MFNITTYALLALSTITGRNLKSDHNIELKPQNYELASQICFKNDTNIKSVHSIFDDHGFDSYALFEFTDGEFILIDKLMNKEIESGFIDNSPYNNMTDSFIIRTDSEHFYYDYISNNFISFETNKYLKSINGRSTIWDEELDDCVSTDFPNATFINNAYYFDNLNSRYGENDGNVCGIIASEILLGYFDTFVNDNVVDEIYDVSGDYCALSSPCENSPGTDYNNEERTNKFRDLLISKATIWNNNDPDIDGMRNGEVCNLLDEYLSFRNINATTFAYPFSTLYSTVLESQINSNKPVLVATSDHFVVIYGYDNDYYYLCTGWVDENGNDTGRVPKHYFTDFSSPFFITLNIDNHVHSNNYYNSSNFWLYCGCSHHHSNRLIVNPSDWDFEEQYYFYQKNAIHFKDNLSFTSRRYRTGYIQSSVINLSPRRQGAGSAWLEIVFSNQIYQVSMNIAWWSQQEYQNDGFAYLKYHEINDSQTYWHAYLANFTELEISQYHGLLTPLRFILPNNCDGIKFDLSNLAVGDRNLGRLSLGQIVFDYYPSSS